MMMLSKLGLREVNLFGFGLGLGWMRFAWVFGLWRI